MAKIFYDEETVKKIIRLMYTKCEVAGLICELCYLRNFRVADIRHAKVGNFRKDNGYAEILLKYDKTRSDAWYPIPIDIFNKIMDFAKTNQLKEDDYVFEITCGSSGKYRGHVGVITHEWIMWMWYEICKELGIYREIPILWKQCSKCQYKIGKYKCSVYFPNIKNRVSIHISKCIKKGIVRQMHEKHPQLHETLRGASAQAKIKHYMAQGLDYERALLRVFHMSNWKNLKTFRMYLDPIFEKQIGNETFIKDFGEKVLIEN